MKEKGFKFMYDEFSDGLIIATKKEDEVIAGSVRILNLIMDITTKGRIANIELIDASDYLKSMEINPQILKKITNAEFSFRAIRNGYLIAILLKSGKKVERVPYNLYLPNSKQIKINSS